MDGVVRSNQKLSSSLSRLGTRRSTSAVRAVNDARTATASARGAVNALTVPKDARRIAANARQTLSREAAYLRAVSATLEDPAAPGAERAETLAANLTDALDVLAPAEADWSQSVAGADNLTGWAARNTRAAARRLAAERQARAKRAAARGERGNSGAPGATPSRGSSGTDCGGGLRAGPNTSCAFAANVRDAWGEAPGVTNTVRVYSPTTGDTYTMSCSPAGTGVTCSGGNNASVSF